MDEDRIRRKLNRIREILKISKTPSELKITKKLNGCYYSLRDYTIANYRTNSWAIQSANFLSILEKNPKSSLINLLKKFSNLLCIPIFEADALYPNIKDPIKTIMVIGTAEDIKLMIILVKYITETEKYWQKTNKKYLQSLPYEQSKNLDLRRALIASKKELYLILNNLTNDLLLRKKSEIHIWEKHTIDKLNQLKEFINFTYKRDYEPERIKK